MSSKILFVWDDKRGYSSKEDKFINSKFVNTYLNLSDDILHDDRIGGSAFHKLDSKDSFEQFKKNTNKTKFNSVFILAEPQWDNNANSWYGYEVLEYLLEHSEDLLDTESEHFKLGVFSIFDRKVVHAAILPNLKRYVEAFPPIKLGFEVEDKSDNYHIDKSSFEFLRKQSIDVYSILDSLEHSIAHCFGDTDPNGDRFKNFVNSYESKKYALKNLDLSEVNDLIKQVTHISQENDRNKAIELCRRIEYELKKRKASFNTVKNTEEDDVNENTLLKGKQVMVIEDDESMNHKISKWLHEYGAEIKPHYLGSSALQELENYRKEGSLPPYHAVITDFEIKDGIFYDTQGTQIIEYLKRHFPQIVFRLMTSMGKETVASTEIFKDLQAKEIITKRENSIVPLGGDSDDIVRGLFDDINQFYKSYGPAKSPTIIKPYITYYYRLSEKERKILVFKILNSLVANGASDFPEDKKIGFDTFNPGRKPPYEEPNLQRLETLLYNRICAIYLCLSNTENYNRDNFQYGDIFGLIKSQRRESRIARYKLLNTYLGFDGIPADEDLPFTIKCLTVQANLFSHEYNLIIGFKSDTQKELFDKGNFIEFLKKTIA